MSCFTSATLGEIDTPVNILKEFLSTFNRREKCKAAILSWFDGRHFYGQEWVRATFEGLAEILGYCRETISHHIKALIEQGLLEEKPSHLFPKDTAFEYRLNLQNLIAVMGLGRCEKTSIDRPNVSPIEANNLATYEVILSPLKENNTDVVEKQEAVKEEDLFQATEEVEQVEVIHSVDELEQVDSGEELDFGEDQGSAPGFKPSKREIKEVCDELKRLRINPEPCLGVLRKYWGNVSGAIARVKEAIQQGWCNNPTGLFINSCKGGVQAKNTLTADVKSWFEWARGQRIVLAMSGEVVYTIDGDSVALVEMMRKYPMRELG